MGAVEPPAGLSRDLGVLVARVDRRYATAALLLTVGAPVVAFATGRLWAVFLVHLALGMVWLGLNVLFKYLLTPALEATGPDTARAVNHQLLPAFIVVAHGLSVGTLASGLGLAFMMGHLARPSPWLWGAMAVGALLLLNGFGPLHVATNRMLVELDRGDGDARRLGAWSRLAGRAGVVQTALMLVAVLMMVGLRGLL